jgi:hypothetical protein
MESRLRYTRSSVDAIPWYSHLDTLSANAFASILVIKIMAIAAALLNVAKYFIVKDIDGHFILLSM